MRFFARVAAIVVVVTLLASVIVVERLVAIDNESRRLRVPEAQATFLSTYNPSTAIRQQSLQLFVNISASAFALGAVYDARDGNMGSRSVRVLLVARGYGKYRCRFPDGTVTGSKLYEMSENHARPFGVYLLNCVVPRSGITEDNVEVRSSETPWVSVPILYAIPEEFNVNHYKYDLTICLPFVYGTEYSGEAFVEFVEMNRILGVQHFVVYLSDSHISSSLNKVIRYYESLGITEVSRILIPVESRMIWYHGQLVAIAECLYRNMGVSRFVAFQDLDEFLIPQVSSTDEMPLLALLKSLFTKDVASIRVPTQYMNIENKGELMTLRNTKRLSYVDTMLTKCVVRPEMIFEQGIHHTSRVIQNHYKMLAGDATVLRLYHYKAQNGGETDDRVVQEYGEVLKKKYEDVVGRIGLNMSS